MIQPFGVTAVQYVFLLYAVIIVYCHDILPYKFKVKFCRTRASCSWSDGEVNWAVGWFSCKCLRQMGEYTGSVGFRVTVVSPQINAKTTMTVTLRDRQKVKEGERKRKRSGGREWKKFAKKQNIIVARPARIYSVRSM